MRTRVHGLLAMVLAGLGLPIAVPAASDPPALAERVEMAFRYADIPSRMPGLALLEPHWLPDGDRFWYADGSPENRVIHLVNPAANTRVELFEMDRLRRALEDQEGHPPPHHGLPFDEFSFADGDEGSVRFAVEGRLYQMDLASHGIQELGEAAPPRPSALASGGRWYRDWVGPYYDGRILGVPSPDGDGSSKRRITTSGCARPEASREGA